MCAEIRAISHHLRILHSPLENHDVCRAPFRNPINSLSVCASSGTFG